MASANTITVDRRRLEAVEAIAVKALLDKGMDHRGIRETTGIPLATVSRRRRKVDSMKASFARLADALDT